MHKTLRSLVEDEDVWRMRNGASTTNDPYFSSNLEVSFFDVVCGDEVKTKSLLNDVAQYILGYCVLHVDI